jgi:sugar diacid utilization regulator
MNAQIFDWLDQIISSDEGLDNFALLYQQNGDYEKLRRLAAEFLLIKNGGKRRTPKWFEHEFSALRDTLNIYFTPRLDGGNRLVISRRELKYRLTKIKLYISKNIASYVA